MADVTARIQVYGLDNAGSPAWVDLDDALIGDGIRHDHGINGTTPIALIGGPGELTFDADNGPDNSLSTRGAYAFGHASARVGYVPGAPARVVYTFNSADYIGWTGKLADTDPDTEYVGDTRSHVVAYDQMNELLEADVREIDPQIDRTASQLLTAILDAIREDAQPPARSFDTTIDDVYPYALYKLGKNTKAVTAIRDVAISGLLMVGATRDGTLRSRSRARFTLSPVGTLDDTKLTALSAASQREDRATSVKATYHPPTIDSAEVVLWEQSGPLFIEPHATFEDSVTFRDPNEISRLIGAKTITTVAVTTDYLANEQEDGLGTDLTASLTVDRDDHSTTADWSIENTGDVGVWITKRKVRGEGIYDDDSPFVTSSGTADVGGRPFEVDLGYQADWRIAGGIADLIRSQLEVVGVQSARATFLANESDALMLLALTAEFGDTVAITNANTGLVSKVMEIRRIEIEFKPGNLLWCTFELALSTDATTPPSVPTGLAVATYSDTELQPTWTNTDPTAQTEFYADGVYWLTAPVGATSAILGGFTRATDYTITAKHVKYALIRSTATAGVVGRPTVVQTGGSYSTFSSGGVTYGLHTVTVNTNIVRTARGRVNIYLQGGGGAAGYSTRTQIGSGAGAGGVGLLFLDNDEPNGTFAVIIGAGGIGDTSSIRGQEGSATIYRAEQANGGGGGGSFDGSTSHDGDVGGNGGGGAGEGADGGVGQFFNGGAGATNGSGNRPGGGGGGAGGAGGDAVNSSAFGGARGAGLTVLGVGGFGQGGKGGGPSETPANASGYGQGGDGVVAAVDGVPVAGKNGFQGVMYQWYPI